MPGLSELVSVGSLLSAAVLAALLQKRRARARPRQLLPGIVLCLVGGKQQQQQRQQSPQSKCYSNNGNKGNTGTSFCEGPFPPHILRNAFQPEDLLGCAGREWAAMMKALSSRLPVQMHMEPHSLRSSPEAPPLFHRTVALLDQFPEFRDLMQADDLRRRGRIKFRLSGRGKFIHRNRYERRNIICCLDGEQHWLLLDTSQGAKLRDDGTYDENSLADQFLGSQQNKNWNGYRSNRWPQMLSVQEMKQIARNAPPGVAAYVIKVKAGDIFSFDGRWWHATSYESPVLSLFFTPGENMEVALAEHKKRMALPMQQGLKIATINMAKCAKLASSWQTAANGSSMMGEWAPGMGHKT